MADLTSRPLIVIKGLLFLVIMAGAALILLLKQASLTAAFAVCALSWASARFYYFLFYVLERYVDPELRYSGVLALTAALFKKTQRRRARP
jgi:hypothetical protein